MGLTSLSILACARSELSLLDLRDFACFKKKLESREKLKIYSFCIHLLFKLILEISKTYLVC